MKKRLTIGILAHVDAGKTTLSEALLYLSGRIRRQGRVDHGTTYLDSNPVERERGITIFSKQARFSRGECDFILDDGKTRETVHLNNPAQGLYIKNYIWREFTNFSEDCVVMVLASEHYNPDDYIHDYEKFLKEVSSDSK